MNRTYLIASGLVAWTLVGVDAVVHLVNGDLLVPVGMAAAFAVWFAWRVVPAQRARLIPVIADRG
jgi:hypothetical protein